MKTKTLVNVGWQVQIWVEEIDEWMGWAHGVGIHGNEKDARREEVDAIRKGWKTRVKLVRDDDS